MALSKPPSVFVQVPSSIWCCRVGWLGSGQLEGPPGGKCIEKSPHLGHFHPFSAKNMVLKAEDPTIFQYQTINYKPTEKKGVTMIQNLEKIDMTPRGLKQKISIYHERCHPKPEVQGAVSPSLTSFAPAAGSQIWEFIGWVELPEWVQPATETLWDS